MSSTPVPAPKVDYPKELWESASSLSDGAISAASRRIRELQFDENQGEIPLEETFINLSSVRDVLLDTVEKGRLVQLPLRLQARLLQESKRISLALVEITNGKDAIRSLEASVEELNATIYQLNLQNQSEQILGYEKKMNELKAQEVIVRRSLARAKKLDKRLGTTEDLINRLAEIKEEAEQRSTFTQTLSDSIKSTNAAVSELKNSASAAFAIVKEYESAIANASTAAESSASDLSTLYSDSQTRFAEITDLKDRFDELTQEMAELKEATKTSVDEQIENSKANETTHQAEMTTTTISLKTAISDGLEASLSEHTERVDALIDGANKTIKKISQDAKDAEEANFAAVQSAISNAKDEGDAVIQKNSDELASLVSRLKTLEDQIDGAILRATGFTLFHSFQKRQEDLKKSTKWWVYAIVACVICSIGAALLFLHYLPYFPSTGPAIYFKISLSLPFIFALTFCSWQYTRERRLEEEYAFKSNISLSLKPYQELVDDLVNKEDPEERAKYTAFIISSINKVFTSPTGLVFDTEQMPGDEAKELLKTALAGAKDIISAKVK